MLRPVLDLRRLSICCVLAVVLACGGEEETASASASAPDAKPLPAFSGTTLEGKPFSASSLLGRRALLFFFNPEVAVAGTTADAVASVARLRADHNFEVVGIAIAASSATSRNFVREHGLDFTVVDDSAARIARDLQLNAPLLLVGTDADGNISFGMHGAPEATPDARATIEGVLRKRLRLPAEATGPELSLGERPRAPAFSAPTVDGETFALASLEGRPTVLIFFLHTCPHCHKALEFLKEALPKMPEGQRPALVGVSLQNQPAVVKASLASDGLDFFPVLVDPDSAVQRAYGIVAGVPDIFVIDGNGSLVTRFQGWREDRDPALMRMWLAKVAGLKVPMLLHSTEFSGSEACDVCHEQQTETWLLTQHASAFDTLVRHGVDTDGECIGCHVVGYEKAGGYRLDAPTQHLEDVGCESCHGRGGPHLSPGFVSAGNYEPICVSCHDQKHSLGFEYARFLPQVSHAANAHLAALPLEEKRKLLAERGQIRADLLPQAADYVGSEACRSCHAAEFDTWSKSTHAHSLASLESQGKAGEQSCLQCHTTAMGRPGGFPTGASPQDHADLARVGCESCHGPGGDHVGENAARVGTIVSLGDKCDSCVILQICGSCHDAANDPGFEFEVQKKIDAQRHGTIDPAAGKAASLSRGEWLAVMEHAFRASDPS